MGFIGGGLRERFVDRVKDVDAGRLLAEPIDVGKRSAAAMVCDFWGRSSSPRSSSLSTRTGSRTSPSPWRAPKHRGTRPGCGWGSSPRATTTVRCSHLLSHSRKEFPWHETKRGIMRMEPLAAVPGRWRRRHEFVRRSRSRLRECIRPGNKWGTSPASSLQRH